MFKKRKSSSRQTAQAWCLACAMWLWTDEDIATCKSRGHNLM